MVLMIIQMPSPRLLSKVQSNHYNHSILSEVGSSIYPLYISTLTTLSTLSYLSWPAVSNHSVQPLYPIKGGQQYLTTLFNLSLHHPLDLTTPLSL